MVHVIRTTLGCLAVAIFLAGSGCDLGSNSRTSRPDNSDEAILRALLSNLGEYSKNLNAMKGLFAASTPVTAKEQKAIRGKQFSLAEPVSIKVEGSSVTFKVRIREGEKETMVDWTATKESDTWKLQKTPLK